VIDRPSWLIPVAGLLTSTLLAVGCYRLVPRLLRQPGGMFTILGTAVLFWSVTIVGLECLGKAGLINPLALFVIALMTFGLGVRFGAPASRAMGALADGQSTETAIHKMPSWDAQLCVGLVWMSAIFLGVRSVLMGVKVVSDGPIYHLYFAARWWKAGRLFLVAAPFGENAATYFPANGDLWFTWLLTTWGGERLAKIGQAPFLLFAMLAVWACTRLMTIDRSGSLVAISCFAVSTPFLLFSFEPNVDTIFVAGYLTAAAFFLRTIKGQGGIGDLTLGALAAGAALGTKAVAVVFVPPLLVMTALGLFSRRQTTAARLHEIAVLFLAPLVTCGYWYAQNIAISGNPIYPLNVRIAGMTFLRGWYDPDAMRSSPYYLPLNDWRSLIDILMAVADARLAPFWLAGLAIGWWCTRSDPPGVRRYYLAFTFLATLNVALYWILIPYRTQQRFMLQSLGLAAVPLAHLLGRFAWLRLAASVSLALHLLTPQPWPLFARSDHEIPWDLSPIIPNAVEPVLPLVSRIFPSGHGAALAPWWLATVPFIATVACSILATWSWFQLARGGMQKLRSAALAGVVTLSSIAIGFGDGFLFGYDSRIAFYAPFRDFFTGWLNFDIRCGPAGARVAYAGTNIPYFLLGNGLRNQVRYVNIDRHRNWLLHDYHRDAALRGDGLWPNSRPGWDRINPSYPDWVANLLAEQIQLLVVTHVNVGEGPHNVADAEGFPIERQWAESHPERFEPLYGVVERDPQFRVYRVLRHRGEP
jgi:Dolichyl-phosphate-mannose-protein mannosyltransferase